MLPWLLLVLLVGLAIGYLGWAMSNRFLVPKSYDLRPEFRIESVSFDDQSPPGAAGHVVTLPSNDRSSQFSDVGKEGVFNLLWDGGYGRLGEVLAVENGKVTRRLEGIRGEPPREGAPARLDSTVYRRDPLADHGIPFEDLLLAGSAGRLHAWWIDVVGERAVLALHGRRRADRTETLRVLPTLVESGWSVLALAYRNHDRSDPSSDGLFHYGASEVEDALTAVAELSRRGVQEVVLYGFSMGGAVALETVKRWPAAAPGLSGIVLDSPLLDPRTVIRWGARDTGLPMAETLADLALAVGSLRTGIDWRSLDQRLYAAAIDVPVLLFAGTSDSTIPIGLIDEFAALLTAPVDYRRFEGVEHVEGWNRERESYEDAVRGFLSALAGATGQRSL